MLKIKHLFLILAILSCLSVSFAKTIPPHPGNNHYPGWTITPSELPEVILSYQKTRDGFIPFSTQTIYVGIPPRGTPKLELKGANFTLYDSSTDYLKAVSSDSAFSIFSTGMWVKFENLGWIRNWRIGRILFTSSHSNYDQYYQMDSVQLRVVTDLTANAPFLNNNNPPEKFGMDTILSSLLVNYSPNSPLRGLPEIKQTTPEEFPGLVAPGLLERNNNWMKVSIPEPGFYRIPVSELQKNGYDSKKTPLTNIRLYSRDNECTYTIVTVTTETGIVEPTLMFYGTIPENPYTASNVYWLSWGKESGAHWKSVTVKVPAVNETKTYQPQALQFQEDLIFDDTIGGRTTSPDHWYWKTISVKSTAQIRIPLSAMEEVSELQSTAELEIILVGKSKLEQCAEHQAILSWDGTTIGTANWQGQNEYSFKTTLALALLQSGNHLLGISLTGTPPANPVDEIYLDKVKLSFLEPLSIHTDGLTIRNTNLSSPTKYILKPVAGNENLSSFTFIAMDSSNQPFFLQGQPFVASNNEISLLLDSTIQQVKILHMASLPIPDIKPYLYNDDLRQFRQQADYIIITHPDFMAAASQMAGYRKKQGFKVRIVNIFDIYDQFSYGNFTPVAIRDFLRYTFYHWTRPAPSYGLLIGDASLDYKGKYNNGVINYVPCYRMPSATEDAASDLWYTQLIGDDLYPDMMIGRISVNNPIDAQNIVNKTIDYEADTDKGEWQNRILFVSDDSFEEDSREMANIMPENYFKKYFDLKNYAYIDNYYLPTGEDSKISTDANKSLIDAISEGDLSIVYFGHGSPNVWGHERILFGGDSKNTDMKKLTNGKKLPFVLNMTCSTGQLDWPTRPWNICIVEDMHRVPNGGAIAVYAPSGKGFTPQHKALTRRLIHHLYDLRQNICGEAVASAILDYYLDTPGEFTPQEFVLFGDPALQLTLPEENHSLSVTPKIVMLGSATSMHVTYDSSRIKDGEAIIEIGENKDEVTAIQYPPGTIPASIFTRLTTTFTKGKLDMDIPVTIPVTAQEIPVRLFLKDKKSQKIESSSSIVTADQYQLSLNISTVIMQQDNALIQGAAQNTGKIDIPGLVFEITLDNLNISSLKVPYLEAGVSQATQLPLPTKPGIHQVIVTARLQDGYALASVQRVFMNSNYPAGQGAMLTHPGEWTHDPETPIQGQPYKMSVFMHNQSALSYSTVTMQLCDENGSIQALEIGTILPYSMFTVNFTWGVPSNRTTAQLSVTFKSQTVWHDSLSVLKPVELSISSTDVKFVKPAFMQGETLFLDITVHNDGDLPAKDVEITGLLGGVSSIGKQLINRTDWRTPSIPEIPPHSYRTIHVRWDAFRESGDQQLQLLVDRNLHIQEINRDNNRVTLPLHILSQPELVIANTESARTANPRTVLLRAKVTNKGEIDADNVVVQFYDHNVKIGDDNLIPVLKFKEEKTVETQWDVPHGKHNVHVEVGMKSRFEKASNLLEVLSPR